MVRPTSNSAFPSTAISPTFGSRSWSCAGARTWHVMGEEGAAGARWRYVESSVERLQVLVTASLAARWASCSHRL